MGGSVTSDGLKTPNNSNLALKGILGIYAMGQINKVLEKRGKEASTTQYYNVSQQTFWFLSLVSHVFHKDAARTQYAEWERLAFASGRVSSSYDQPSSWALAYNLYPARLMGADFIGKSVSPLFECSCDDHVHGGAVCYQVLDGQTSFYSSRFTQTGANNLGIGYDSNEEFIVKSRELSVFFDRLRADGMTLAWQIGRSSLPQLPRARPCRPASSTELTTAFSCLEELLHSQQHGMPGVEAVLRDLMAVPVQPKVDYSLS